MPPGPTLTVSTLIADPVRRRRTHGIAMSARGIRRRSVTVRA
jgi:hypothetical protein